MGRAVNVVVKTSDMIAVSSFRPLGQDADWDRNQLAARATWEKVFDGVVYFNEPDERMSDERTVFVGGTVHPTIKDMCGMCSMYYGWTCIINADIKVNRNLVKAQEEADERKAEALVSYRWQPKDGKYSVIDNGLDFFAAKQNIWEQALQSCPSKLRIGHPTWDTWMIGFLNAAAKRKFYNITKYACIFHPIHEGRRHTIDVSGVLDGARGYYGMPPLLPILKTPISPTTGA